MKKLLLTAIMAFAFCGSFFAQETHWPDFNGNVYPFQKPVIAYVQVNGNYIDVADGWANLEIAAFVGEQCRGHMFMNDFTEDGDLFPSVELSVYYNNTGEDVSFVLFDHATSIEYSSFTVFVYNDEGTLLTLHTGEYHDEIYFDPEEAIVLSFTGEEPQGETFTKDIEGYTGDADNYYLIASPVGTIPASNVENLTAYNYDFYSFNQSMPAEEWNNLKNVNAPEMEIGKGYLYANSQDVTLSFTGTPIEDASYEVALVYDPNCTTVWKGYNLIGNPYADWAYIEDGRDFLRMVNGEFVLDDTDGDIEAMEGVFVQAVDADDNSVTFLPSVGVEPIEPEKKCVLNVTAGRGLVDRAIIRFGEARQMTKLQFNSSHSKLYIPQDGEDYAVVRSAEMGEMPVNFKAGENGNYMLSVNPKNVEFNYLHLIDNLTGADVDLLVNPSYSFEANTTDYASRFKLVFATGANDENFAFFSNGSFVISNEGEATLQVIDVNGRILNNETISGSANVHVNAAPGVYMLRLINGNNVKVQKVIVK